MKRLPPHAIFMRAKLETRSRLSPRRHADDASGISTPPIFRHAMHLALNKRRLAFRIIELAAYTFRL